MVQSAPLTVIDGKGYLNEVEERVFVSLYVDYMNGESNRSATTKGMATHPSLLTEIGPDGIARESPVIAYTEKEFMLRFRYIKENYSKIRDVERELENLTLELKLTAGPKKAALEHLRKKIEISNEKISVAKVKEDEARKVWEEASKAVKDEEAIKQKLCDDLNHLVQESSASQYARLEELKRRLEALNPSRASSSDQHEIEGGKVRETQTITESPSSVVKNTEESPVVQMPGNSQSHVGDVNSPPTKTKQQQPHDGEGGGKKRQLNLGRAKGSGTLPKGRGSAGSGWTGAGFDVDGRT
ncbi:hypothetical protein QJS04_geneDACA010802 [Acorus gramineus]|uniref:RAB6-interacting golgin n=1 Tax=Acorus gramineus TaxID=55184 RepID=A0AAV9BAA0_ACOGR|nr:hypothetical protein QJS04_geneDACA010802 [Acorus gramineus]